MKTISLAELRKLASEELESLPKIYDDRVYTAYKTGYIDSQVYLISAVKEYLDENKGAQK